MVVQFLYSKEKEALLMTINQVISLINIKDIPFVPQMSGVREKGKLPIYSSKQGYVIGMEKVYGQLELIRIVKTRFIKLSKA